MYYSFTQSDDVGRLVNFPSAAVVAVAGVTDPPFGVPLLGGFAIYLFALIIVIFKALLK